MSDETRCARERERLPWYAAGQLSVEERQRIAEHLRTCAACRQEVAEWRAIGEQVAAASQTTQPARSFEDSWASLAQRLPARPAPASAPPARPATTPRAWPSWRRLWPTAGGLPRLDVAALVVALVALAVAGGRESLPGWAVSLVLFALVCAGLAGLRLGRELARARRAPSGASVPPVAPLTRAAMARPGRAGGVAISLTALVAVVASGIFLWQGASRQAAPGVGQVLRMAWPGTGQGEIPLDPAQSAGNPAARSISRLLFDTLVTTDAQLNVELWAAESVTSTPDGRTYSFRLRADQRFADGTPVHASDYAYSLNRALDPCLGISEASDLWMIQDARAFHTEGCAHGVARGRATLIGDSLLPDDRAGTLTVKLEAPSSDFLLAMALPLAAVVERAAVTGAGLGQDGRWTDALARGRGSSGMFQVSAYDHAGTLNLRANPTWWGRAHGKAPRLAEIALRLTPAAGPTPAALYAHDPTLAVAGPLQPTDQPPLARSADLRSVGLASIETVLLDWQQAPFDDVDARQAFCLAINRDALMASDPAIATTPTWHLLPPGLPSYDPTLTGPDGVTATSGDLATARAHWATYVARNGARKGAPLQLHATLEDPLVGPHAGALAAQWNAAFGPNTVALSSAGQTHSTIGPDDPHPVWLDATLLIWQPDIASPHALVSQLIQATVATPRIPSDLARVLALLARADTGGGGDDPQTLYQQAEQALIAGAYLCPLFQLQRYYLVRPTVHGYTEDALGAVPLDAWVGMSIS